MAIMVLETAKAQQIRFDLLNTEAPVTVDAWIRLLPLKLKLLHARTSGEELWTPDGPGLNIALENASVHIEPGEMGIAPVHPRNKISKCVVLAYGPARLHDCANLFARVIKEDEEHLRALGNVIWMEGAQTVLLHLQK
jgi:hypothetical protein